MILFRSIPMIIMYTIKTPALFITTDACSTILPHSPKVWPISHPYDVILPWWLHLTRMIIRIPGIRPSILILAGRAMIPAPTIVVDRLNTAHEKEAPLNSWITPF
jgi:hypothetical protein